MGIDFIRKAAPSFRKGLDNSRLALGTPGFFTRQPVDVPRTYSAALHSGIAACSGEELGAVLVGDRVVLLRGLESIGFLKDPPLDLLGALTQSFNTGCAVVEELLELSNSIEVSIC